MKYFEEDIKIKNTIQVISHSRCPKIKIHVKPRESIEGHVAEPENIVNNINDTPVEPHENIVNNINDTPAEPHENIVNNITGAPAKPQENITINITDAPAKPQENITINITDAPAKPQENMEFQGDDLVNKLDKLKKQSKVKKDKEIFHQLITKLIIIYQDKCDAGQLNKTLEYISYEDKFRHINELIKNNTHNNLHNLCGIELYSVFP